jgi:alanyl-tRNA synthetase
MTSEQIRESFLKYFENNGHTRVKSSSLVPAADPTLLFTNSGMVQFKDCFLGVQDNGYTRATTSQKCVRAGGKHNDLENVGFTPRHHTFFEMLGNFSFGDYFKEEAIALAWKLLVEEWKLPKEKLWVTVFESDLEAENLWKKIGQPAERIERLGAKDNFWAMGDTGPCGPCTEIHFDWGPTYGKGQSPGTDKDGRFLEIWNLVFMQFNRDSQGAMTPLPKPSVDTGSGLERVSSVLQGKFSNYDCDLFAPIIQSISQAVGQPYKESLTDSTSASLRVVADHLRSCTFLIADGVTPSNEGRGYVLRRILRRAIRHGKKLGVQKPFLYGLVKEVTRSLGKFYPEIVVNQNRIETYFREEEEKFHETLHRGMSVLEAAIAESVKSQQKKLSGEVAFKLYDTFGFPLDLTSTIAEEHKLTIDETEFEKLMTLQRTSSQFKGALVGAATENINKKLEAHRTETRFVGYEHVNGTGNLAILFDEEGKDVLSLKEGEKGFAVFDTTPFYAESGGQVGDSGHAESHGNRVSILGSKKNGKTVLHQVEVEKGVMEVRKNFVLKVDEERRRKTTANHTSTHLLHAALRSILGERVKQAGSLVEPEKLRFDFSYPKAVSEEELLAIEATVNRAIRRDLAVECDEMPYDKALETGAIAFFDEKYGDTVRVVSVGGKEDPFSVEFCGGTHLVGSSLLEIGVFKILSESSVASGVRRIEAVTGEVAFGFLNDRHSALRRIEQMLGTSDAAAKIQSLQATSQALQKTVEKLQLQVAQGNSSGTGGQIWDKAESVGSFRLVMESLPAVNPKVLRTLVDQVRDKLKTGSVVVLASSNDGKVSLCLGLTSDLTSKYNASALIQPLAKGLGGTGGGKPDFAQAGGADPARIEGAFAEFRTWLATL